MLFRYHMGLAIPRYSSFIQYYWQSWWTCYDGTWGHCSHHSTSMRTDLNENRTTEMNIKSHLDDSQLMQMFVNNLATDRNDPWSWSLERQYRYQLASICKTSSKVLFIWCDDLCPHLIALQHFYWLGIYRNFLRSFNGIMYTKPYFYNQIFS